MEQELINRIPELTDLILPWLGIMLSVVVFMWFKDYALQISKGLKFKLDPHFQEGDQVWLEDEPAVIVKIGLSSTVFGIVNGRGYIWRFVPNESIFDMKLEKVMELPHLCSRGRTSEIEAVQTGDKISEQLNSMGHDITRNQMTSGLNIIWKGQNLWTGASDHRREGVAIGF